MPQNLAAHCGRLQVEMIAPFTFLRSADCLISGSVYIKDEFHSIFLFFGLMHTHFLKSTHDKDTDFKLCFFFLNWLTV